MQLRKLFTSSNEQKPSLRHRRESEYVEGRGLYPERRDIFIDPSEFTSEPDREVWTFDNSILDESRLDNSGRDNDSLDNYRSDSWFDSRFNNSQRHDDFHGGQHNDRRRIPLTTLDALLQIKAYGLAHSSA